MIEYDPPAMNSIREALIIAKRKAIQANDIVMITINDIVLFVTGMSDINGLIKTYHDRKALQNEIEQIKRSR